MPVPDSIVKDDEAQSSTWEVEARTHIGRACLIRMKQRVSRSMEFSASQPQVAIPAPMTSMPSLVHKLSKARHSRALLPRSLEMVSVPANVLYPMHKPPAQRGDFLEYARNYWLDCNQHLSLESETGKLFSQVAMNCNKSGGTPWSDPTFTSSVMNPADAIGLFGNISVAAEHQLERMFAYSVANGHLPLLKLILRQKDLPRSRLKGNFREHKNLPALHLACSLGHDNLLFDLARNGDVFATSHMSKTALHYAAEAGHLNCVKQIIHFSNNREKASNKVKFYVDQEDSESRTALHLAVMNGHEDVALFLVKHEGAKLRSAGSKKRHSAIDLAWKHGHGHVLKSILELSDQTQLDELQALDKHGRSKLILAAMAGETNRVEVLCSLCEVNALDQRGATALAHASYRGHESVVRVLMRSVYFDLDEELLNEYESRTSALSLAAQVGRVNVVRFLLENDFIVQMVMERSLYLPWLPIEEVVFGYYHRHSHSLETAKVIVGTMVTSLPTLRSMAINGRLKAPVLGFASKDRPLTQGACELRTLDIFLRAAAEIGHVDAIQHLLELRETEPYRTQTTGATMDMSSYLGNRETGPDTVMGVLGISLEHWSLQNPAESVHILIPIFLAAVRQHEEVLAMLLHAVWKHQEVPAMLLPRQHTFIQDLLERARGVHLGCRGFPGEILKLKPRTYLFSIIVN